MTLLTNVKPQQTPTLLGRLPGGLWIFSATLGVMLVVQILLLVVINMFSREAISSQTRAEALSAASSVFRTLDIPILGPRKMSYRELLIRTREVHGLETIFIMDRHQRLILSDGPDGLSASTVPWLDISPALVDEAFRTGQTIVEEITVLGAPYIRVYKPMGSTDAERVLLCVVAYDPVNEQLGIVRAGLLASGGFILIMAMAVSLLVYGVSRWNEQARHELFRSQQLAGAGQLSATMAHDVKTPLGTILSSVQLLRADRNIPGPERDVLLRNIEEEARRAGDQIDSFLDLARDTAVRRKEENLGELLKTTSDLLRARCRQAGVDIVVDTPAKAILAKVDRGKLRRALMNIIVNSLEALEGRPNPLIHAWVKTTGQGIELGVTDNGPGMTEMEARKALEPFHTTKPHGTGLGLPQARQAAEQHGGSLTVSSRPGQGTTLTIHLPSEGGSA